MNVTCGCGRTMRIDGARGAGAFRCGCGIRIMVEGGHERQHHEGECIFITRNDVCVKPPFRDTPLCVEHLSEIVDMRDRFDIAGGEARERMDVVLAERRAAHLAEREEAEARYQARMKARPQVVYYVRLGEWLKIGTTINLRQRMSELRIDDPAQLLAAEPGGRDLEARRHTQFRQHRPTRRENFVPVPRLMEHVAAVREEHGDPWQFATRPGPQSMFDKTKIVRLDCESLQDSAEAEK